MKHIHKPKKGENPCHQNRDRYRVNQDGKFLKGEQNEQSTCAVVLVYPKFSFSLFFFLNKLSDQMSVLEKVTIEQAQVLMSLKRTS